MIDSSTLHYQQGSDNYLLDLSTGETVKFPDEIQTVYNVSKVGDQFFAACVRQKSIDGSQSDYEFSEAIF